MHDAPDSSPNNLRVEMEDILDPDERTNDEVEERRTADHDGEFYDDDRDQDGDTMPLPPLRYDINHEISYTHQAPQKLGKFHILIFGNLKVCQISIYQ